MCGHYMHFGPCGRTPPLIFPTCDVRHLLCNLLTAKKDLTLCCTHVIYQVHTQKLVRSEKLKIGKDQFVDR